MTRRCNDCGAPFDGEHWQRYCWSCWRRQKDSNQGDRAYHRGFLDGLAAGQRAGIPRPALDRDLLTRTIALCHPDRHPPERTVAANEVTALLLDLRARLAA